MNVRCCNALGRSLLCFLALLCSIQVLAVEQPTAAGSPRNVRALDISITVFDAGIPSDEAAQRDLQIFPRIRQVEAKFLPFVLRQTLADTDEWGVVRVVPKANGAEELLVTGTIEKSDGNTLALAIKAVDASGRVWLSKTFSGTVADSYGAKNVATKSADYQQLYNDISNALLFVRRDMDDKTLADIAKISLLRYADQLAPSAFDGYLAVAADGTYSIQRLPAENDPMLERIEHIRGVEYVITDSVDEKYRQLHGDIAAVYDIWREHRRKSAKYRAEDVQHLHDTQSDAPSGSFEALESQYDNYKWHRTTEQEQDRLAVAFNNEVGPKVAAIETRVDELDGWVDSQYAEWRRLLEELFQVESGLPATNK